MSDLPSAFVSGGAAIIVAGVATWGARYVTSRYQQTSADTSLRLSLITNMTESTARILAVCRHYALITKYGSDAAADPHGQRIAEVHSAFLEFDVRQASIANQLRGYFGGAEQTGSVTEDWHSIGDLVLIFYLALVGHLDEENIALNVPRDERQHSGLNADELRKVARVAPGQRVAWHHVGQNIERRLNDAVQKALAAKLLKA